MAGGWPVQQGFANIVDIATQSGTSTGTSLLSGGSANTKGSWTQLIASTGSDACALLVGLNSWQASTGEFAIDIGIGGAGSEQALIQNLGFWGAVLLTTQTLVVPISIPAGARVSARAQSTLTSADVVATVHLMDGNWATAEGAAAVDTYGWVSASTHGTTVDPGAVANTKGAWAQLTASTTNDICGLFAFVDCAGVTGNSAVSANVLVDIGIGAAASEQALISNMEFLKLNSSSDLNTMVPQYTPLIPVQIPSGTRIAARCQSGLTTATQRNIGVTVYGVRC